MQNRPDDATTTFDISDLIAEGQAWQKRVEERFTTLDLPAEYGYMATAVQGATLTGVRVLEVAQELFTGRALATAGGRGDAVTQGI